MALDPQAQKLVDAMVALNLPPIEKWTPAEARASMRQRTAGLGPVEDVAAVADHRIPVAGGEITARVTTPAGPGPHPAVVFFHGGGWVIGDIETHDGACRALTNAARCAVVNVDYRLAPEFKYPTAVEDSYAALTWVAANASKLNIDARKLAVCGDSAGGNLSAAVSLMARDRRGPAIALQVLIYPVTDYRFDTGSYREFEAGPVLTHAGMRYFWKEYLRTEADGAEPYASPMRATSLAGLPPALVITVEADPLRDEGEAYAARLRDAGVPVTLTRYAGMFHGTFRFTRLLEKSRAMMDEVAGALGKAFA